MSLVDWLVQLDESALATLLDRRPDALMPPAPRHLGELAERLDHPASVAHVLSLLPLPCLQLAEAVTALGPAPTLDALGSLLRSDQTHHAPDEQDHLANVARTVALLVDVAVLWPTSNGTLGVASALAELYPSPLDLGPPLLPLVQARSADALRQTQSALGLTRGKTKDAVVQSLVAHLSDPEVVRKLVADAPVYVQEELERQARQRPDDGDIGYDMRRYRAASEAAAWATARGLLFGNLWGVGWQMPAEVALALRGPGYHAPFSPVPPEPVLHVVADHAVESESSAAATALADHATTLLDLVGRKPAALLKSGGLGVRELTRLAKAAGTDEVTARLVLELADAAGLLAADRQLGVSSEFTSWRSASPGERYATLLRTWWLLGATPTEARDDTGKALPVLRGMGMCRGCQLARQSTLATIAALPQGHGAELETLALNIAWGSPLLHMPPEDQDRPLGTVWREAGLLGLVAHGALSALGRDLLSGDALALAERATSVLPASADRATFGTDLTALAVGAPSAGLSSLLDTCAEREGRGGATIWRLSPTSVRRALDEGLSGEELLARLAAISTSELPQPLRYLVTDVARRHGLLRVTPAVAMISSEDTALLAEVSVDRRLRKLGLRLVAPTVLACGVPADEALTAMRSVGYFPMPATNGPMGATADGAASRSTRATGSASSSQRELRAWVRQQGLGDLLGPDLRLREGALQGDDPGDRLGPDDGPRSDLDDGPDEPDDDELFQELLLALPRVTAPPEEPVSPAEAASKLVGRRSGPVGVPTSTTHGELSRYTSSLSSSEIRLLAFAIDNDGPVQIDYEASTGGNTSRVISGIEHSAGTLFAWCELRQDDRIFSVSRIRSVSPAI